MRLDPNLNDPDSFYASLVAANERLTEDQSFDFLIRLLMILANQIGDAALVQICIEEAQKQSHDQTQEVSRG